MLYEEYAGLTVFQMLRRMTERFGDRPAVLFREGKEIVTRTYTEFFQDCCTIAEYLEQQGIYHQYVTVDARTSYPCTVSLFAIMAAGGYAIPLNCDLPEEELQAVLEQTNPKLFIYDREDEDLLLSDGQISRLCLTGDREYPEKSVSGILAENKTTNYQPAGKSLAGDPACVLLTSGSTNIGKLVVLPHSGISPCFRVLPDCAESQLEILLYPFYHIVGFNVFLQAVCAGIPCILSDFIHGIADMAELHPTNIMTIPLLMDAIVSREQAGLLSLEGVRYLGSTAAPQHKKSVRQLQDKGIFSMSLYGSTETGGFNTFSTPQVHKFGSVGKPGPWNQIRISPEGEILVKSPRAMLKYLGNTEETEASLQDGWFHTGDLGRIDEDGFLFITGRIKNVIILSGGENVSPEAIESELKQFSGLEEVMVYGREDKIEACLYIRDRNPEKEKQAEKFISRYNRRVPTYRRIRSIVYRDSPFEKTGSGKIKRHRMLLPPS